TFVPRWSRLTCSPRGRSNASPATSTAASTAPRANAGTARRISIISTSAAPTRAISASSVPCSPESPWPTATFYVRPFLDLPLMPKDFLKDCRDSYDVIVIGSGLAGLTSANILARAGHSVLLLEHHYQLGGMATWFKRRNGHIFDISLHGFPVGMIKSCCKYWTREIAD